MSLAKMVDTLKKIFITLAKVGEELSETYKVKYLRTSMAAEWLNAAKTMILGDIEKMNDFVKAKNFLLLSNVHSDSGKKHTQGVSATKSLGQKNKKEWCWLDSFGKALVHVNEDFHCWDILFCISK